MRISRHSIAVAGAVIAGLFVHSGHFEPFGSVRRAVAAPPPPGESGRPGVAELGRPAPDFTLVDLDGKPVRLGAFRGKKVVLEWFNPDCPFVRFAHGSGPLKDLGARYAKQGVVWLAINSGAPGKQGAGLERNRAAVTEYGISYPILLDEPGRVGRRYGAKSTPHMFMIDEQGALVYRGAVDNAPLGTVEGGGAAVNYVDAAMADLAARRPVKVSETKAYGCSVKYGS